VILLRVDRPTFHNVRWANRGVAGAFSPDGLIQNDSGLPQGPGHRVGGKLRMRRTDCEGGALVSGIRRRDFVILLGGGAAAAWPLTAHPQQPDGMRRIGILLALAEDDLETKARLAAFRQGLEKRGWSEGRNVRIDYRFAPDSAQLQVLAKELVALQPDVILAQSTPATAALQRESRTIPIVFAIVSDPIGSGFVASLPRPGGNITGVMLYEASVTGKWLAMLKEIAPRLVRAALVANPKTATFYDSYVQAAEAAAPSLGIGPVPTFVENASDIERAIASFGSAPDGGLVLIPDVTATVHRDLIIALAARHRVPAVYFSRIFVTDGGLMSYGTDLVDMSRQAASYVDRILRGDKPADLPVQAATKFETIINLKTARALGLTVPPGLLVAADEVIE
jgi:putative tryptophan/tyrosine transport system substrate-binding protein